jgi:hypothetical protein
MGRLDVLSPGKKTHLPRRHGKDCVLDHRILYCTFRYRVSKVTLLVARIELGLVSGL